MDLTSFAPVLAAIVTAAGASVVTYLTMRRAKSGRINSSEADILWEESTAIRRELRDQVGQLENHIGRNEAEISHLRVENADLKHEVLKLRSENAGLTLQIEGLKAENVDLRRKQESLTPEAR